MALSCVLALVGTSLRLALAVVWTIALGLFSAKFYSLVWMDLVCPACGHPAIWGSHYHDYIIIMIIATIIILDNHIISPKAQDPSR